MERPRTGSWPAPSSPGVVQVRRRPSVWPSRMASEGLLSLPAGIALALGANIGTCATALLAALGKPVEAVRAATVHVLFNVARSRCCGSRSSGCSSQASPWRCSSRRRRDSKVCERLGGRGAAADRQRQHAVQCPRTPLLFIGFTGWFAASPCVSSPAARRRRPSCGRSSLIPARWMCPALRSSRCARNWGASAR